MSDETIKVTDKRMFTADGLLKEEFRFLESAPAATQETVDPSPSEPLAGEDSAAEPPWSQASPELPELPPGLPADAPVLELPDAGPGFGKPTFYDLVGLLAEPAALYLGDLALPTGESAENLDMARLHIDLLDVLRVKSAGNLSVQERGYLEELLYRLRVRYVQKRG